MSKLIWVSEHPWLPVYEVSCPFCEAAAERYCTTHDGKTRWYQVHEARVHKAQGWRERRNLDMDREVKESGARREAIGKALDILLRFGEMEHMDLWRAQYDKAHQTEEKAS